MILNDRSFERSHWGEYYALYFETRMFSGYANNCDYMAIFDRLFTIFQKSFFVKFHGGPTII